MLWKANESTKCKCLCDCGNVVTALASGIKAGKTLSCGCLHSDRTREGNTKDWTGIKSDWGVTILRPYKQNDQGVWIWECECGLCGKHFYELPIKVLNGSQKSCGCAKRSSGEAHIEKYLREHSIIYKSQYSFKECKDKQVLLFDFAVFDDNGKLSFLIEYDGQQHYKSIDWFGGESALRIRQKHDRMKDEYCRNHRIPLYRIAYTMKTAEIEALLTNIINP